jgi:molybdopterin-guanine dinucleotide biosynthesis protein A
MTPFEPVDIPSAVTASAAPSSPAISPPLFGLLLCGGRSSRMGQDKALLQLGGPLGPESLLQRGLRLLREAGCGGVWLSGDYPGFAAIPDDPAWCGRGPLAGIASALQRYPEARWLILPVDMPGMDVPLLRALVRQGAAHPVGSGVQGSQFPLLLQPGALPVLKTLLVSSERHDYSVQALLRQLGLPLLPAEQLLPDVAAEVLQRTLGNTNTPEEWRRYADASKHFAQDDSPGAASDHHPTITRTITRKRTPI